MALLSECFENSLYILGGIVKNPATFPNEFVNLIPYVRSLLFEASEALRKFEAT